MGVGVGVTVGVGTTVEVGVGTTVGVGVGVGGTTVVVGKTAGVAVVVEIVTTESINPVTLTKTTIILIAKATVTLGESKAEKFVALEVPLICFIREKKLGSIFSLVNRLLLMLADFPTLVNQ